NSLEMLLCVMNVEIPIAKRSVNPRKIVGSLQDHSGIQRDYQPLASGDPSSAEAQASVHKGAPSILSIDLVDGEDAVPRFVNGLQCFTLAANIGDARSLVIHPATTTHSHF